MRELEKLYLLQAVEYNLDALRKQLKELTVYGEFERLKEEVTGAREAVGRAEAKLAEQQKRVKRLELDVKKAEQEAASVQARLYSGAVTSARELAQLEAKAKALLKERDKAEESTLLAMEAAEEAGKALSLAKEKLHASSARLKELQKKGNEEISDLKKRILACQREGEVLLGEISKELLDRYRELRRLFHGRPLALVEGDICGGCRVAISSNLKNRLCNPGALITCENCGRLLVLRGS